MVRHRFLVPACKGSNPFTPDYEHPIGSVKNKLTTTREAVQSLSLACSKPRVSLEPTLQREKKRKKVESTQLNLLFGVLQRN